MLEESRRLDGLSLAEVAELVGASFEGDDPTRVIHSVAPLESATLADVSLFDDRANRAALATTEAAAVIVSPDFGGGAGRSRLLSSEPQRAFAVLAQELWRRTHIPPPGIASSAEVDPGADVGAGVHIGPGCRIGPGVRIERGATLHGGVSLAGGATVGEETTLCANVCVGAGCRIGARCFLHPGVVVGFEYRQSPHSGGAPGKSPSTGVVVIEDDVEIGPNSVVERGERKETRICHRVRLGALVMVGHDSVVGPRAELVSMVGLAGDVEVGADAILLGQVGVTSRARIGARSVVLAKSGVAGGVPSDACYAGIIARPRHEWLKAQAALRRLPQQLERLAGLERRIEARLELLGEPRQEERHVR